MTSFYSWESRQESWWEPCQESAKPWGLSVRTGEIIIPPSEIKHICVGFWFCCSLVANDHNGNTNQKGQHSERFRRIFLKYLFDCTRSQLDTWDCLLQCTGSSPVVVCGASAVVACRLNYPAARWVLPSSPTRDQTHTPWIGRWILNPWTTREVLEKDWG